MYRCLLIGAGRMGYKRAKAIHEHPDTVLSCIIDQNSAKAKEMAMEYQCNWGSAADLEANLDAADLFVISVYHSDFYDLLKKLIPHGKPIFCEKPMGISYQQMKDLESITGKPENVFVGYTLRSYPAIREAKELIQGGELGKLLHLRAEYGHGGRVDYHKEWRFVKSQSGGGQLVDQGSHLLDLTNYFMGDASEIKATLSTHYWKNEDNVEDYASITIKSKQGQVSNLVTACTMWKNKFRIEMILEKGYLIIEGLNGYYGRHQLIVGRRESLGTVPYETTTTFPLRDYFTEEWNYFMDEVQNRGRGLCTYQEALDVLQMIEATYDSDRLQKTIHFTLGGEKC